MKKIRLTLVQTKEYVPNPEWYPKDSTISEMAQLDANTDDISLLFDTGSDDTDTKVLWEIIEEDEDGSVRVLERGESEAVL